MASLAVASYPVGAYVLSCFCKGGTSSDFSWDPKVTTLATHGDAAENLKLSTKSGLSSLARSAREVMRPA